MRRLSFLMLIPVLSLVSSACGSGGETGSGAQTSAPATSTAPAETTSPDSVPMSDDLPEVSIVVTHAVLGAVVSDLVGESAEVSVLIPNGVDPHAWEPSAKDVEAINDATLVVANGLNLEESLEGVLESAEAPVFFATDHIRPLTGESHDHDHAHDDHAHDDHAHDDHAHDETESKSVEEAGHAHDDHAHEGGDPHFWTDPLSVAEVVEHLSEELANIGLDVADQADSLIADLTSLDADVTELLASIPPDDRVLVTGHVSMAYFAAHYGFELLGSIVPSLSSSAEASAADLSDLKKVIAAEGVSVIFAEVGAPEDVVQALADETGVRVVVVSSHTVPDEGTYRSFLLALASQVRDALTA